MYIFIEANSYNLSRVLMTMRMIANSKKQTNGVRAIAKMVVP